MDPPYDRVRIAKRPYTSRSLIALCDPHLIPAIQLQAPSDADQLERSGEWS